MQLNWQILHIAQCLLRGPCTNYNIWITNPRLNHLASPASHINLVSLIQVISSAEVRYLCPDSWNALHYPWMAVIKRVSSSLSLRIWNHTVMNMQSYISHLFYTKELLSMNTKAESETQRSKSLKGNHTFWAAFFTELHSRCRARQQRNSLHVSLLLPSPERAWAFTWCPWMHPKTNICKKNSVMMHLRTNSPEKKKSLERFYFHVK